MNTGLLDHRKTWRYRVAATPQDCVSGFIAAFSRSGGLVIKAKWSVTRSPNGFTMDGRFIRPSMRAVEDQLRQVDPSLQVVKD